LAISPPQRCRNGAGFVRGRAARGVTALKPDAATTALYGAAQHTESAIGTTPEIAVFR
jgi:hypothetical protein